MEQQKVGECSGLSRVETGLGEVQFNNDLSKDMVRYFKDKVDKGLMITRALNGDAYNSDSMKVANPKTYMYVGSTGGTRYAYVGMPQDVFDAGYRVGVAGLLPIISISGLDSDHTI